MAKRMEEIFRATCKLYQELLNLRAEPSIMEPVVGIAVSLIMNDLHTHLETLMARTPEFKEADIDAINHELLDWLNLTIEGDTV